jgi:hypothetical protein
LAPEQNSQSTTPGGLMLPQAGHNENAFSPMRETLVSVARITLARALRLA